MTTTFVISENFMNIKLQTRPDFLEDRYDFLSVFKLSGRPRLEWEEYVERLACKRGRKLPEVKRLAQNRKEYRKWLLEPDA